MQSAVEKKKKEGEGEKASAAAGDGRSNSRGKRRRSDVTKGKGKGEVTKEETRQDFRCKGKRSSLPAGGNEKPDTCQCIVLGLPIPTTDNENPAKRPLHQKRKSKRSAGHLNGVLEMDNVECDKAVDLEVEYSMRVEERSCSAESVKEKGAKESENKNAEWDAKSWDEAVVNGSLKHGSSYEPEPCAEKRRKECRHQDSSYHSFLINKISGGWE
ncbi:hypothetical protein ACFX2F_030418 [Malus domestica]|uniref:Uncharacterized protein n=1 Tax=Malus domestica TaxID=3750 RepID=A0A498K6L8_MALDO|nr:hypothetical protein DVH24_003843 [Malus domestica]